MRVLRALGGMVALGLLVLPLPAAADTSATEVGLTGAHHLVDTSEDPGGWCGYTWDDEYPLLYLIRVDPPVVFARDRTPGRDRGSISWRVVLQAKGDGAAWVIGRFEWHRAVAWDDTSATLGRLIVRLPRTDFEHWAAVRAVVEMRWHRAGRPGTIEGSSRHRVDHLLVSAFDDRYDVRRCPTWGTP